jgi:hypothetical protein
LDSAIAALNAIRSDIDHQDDQALDERLTRARQGRETWWKGRVEREWVNDGAANLDIPQQPGVFNRLFGIGKRPNQKRDQNQGN